MYGKNTYDRLSARFKYMICHYRLWCFAREDLFKEQLRKKSEKKKKKEQLREVEPLQEVGHPPGPYQILSPHSSHSLACLAQTFFNPPWREGPARSGLCGGQLEFSSKTSQTWESLQPASTSSNYASMPLSHKFPSVERGCVFFVCI